MKKEVKNSVKKILKPDYEKMAIDGYLEYQKLIFIENVSHLNEKLKIMKDEIISNNRARLISNLCNLSSLVAILILVFKMIEKL